MLTLRLHVALERAQPRLFAPRLALPLQALSLELPVLRAQPLQRLLALCLTGDKLVALLGQASALVLNLCLAGAKALLSHVAVGSIIVHFALE